MGMLYFPTAYSLQHDMIVINCHVSNNAQKGVLMNTNLGQDGNQALFAQGGGQVHYYLYLEDVKVHYQAYGYFNKK